MKKTFIPLAAAIVLATTVCIADAQQDATRVFAISTATVEPGRMAEYMGIVEESVMPFLAEQGVEVVGVFQNGIGAPSNELVIWLAYRDLAHVQSVSENSTLTDLQRQTFEGMRVLDTRTLNPVPFSPLK